MSGGGEEVYRTGLCVYIIITFTYKYIYIYLYAHRYQKRGIQ